MADEQLGPVENGLNTGVNWVINNLVPKDSQQAWKDHYAANRSLWNAGIIGTGVAGTAALANAAANAFGSNNNGNNNGGGGGSSWGWLLPVAGLAGAGLWAWNRWGGKLTNYLDTRTSQANQLAKNDQVWLDRYSRFTNWTQGKGWNTDEEYDEEYENEVKNNPELRKLRQQQERESASYRRPPKAAPPKPPKPAPAPAPKPPTQPAAPAKPTAPAAPAGEPPKTGTAPTAAQPPPSPTPTGTK